MSKPTATDRFLELKLQGKTRQEALAGSGLVRECVNANDMLRKLREVLSSRLHDEDPAWLEEQINERALELKELKRVLKAIYWLREREM